MTPTDQSLSVTLVTTWLKILTQKEKEKQPFLSWRQAQDDKAPHDMYFVTAQHSNICKLSWKPDLFCSVVQYWWQAKQESEEISCFAASSQKTKTRFISLKDRKVNNFPFCSCTGKVLVRHQIWWQCFVTTQHSDISKLSWRFVSFAQHR